MKRNILIVGLFMMAGCFTRALAQSGEPAPFIKKAPAGASQQSVTPAAKPTAKFVTPSNGKPDKKTLPASSAGQQEGSPMIRRANTETK